MKRYYIHVLFLIYSFAFINAAPTEKSPDYTKHKNYILLPSTKICGPHSLIDKIVGGNATDLGEYPWIVRLKYKSVSASISGTNQFGCAGSLINERYVVTAAHCIGNQSEIVQVRLGEHNVTTDPDWVKIDVNQTKTADPVMDVDVEEIISHQEFNKVSKHNDIALIRLKKNITFTDYIAPICLPLNGEISKFFEKKKNKIFTVAGWGLTENNMTSPIKLQANVPPVDFKSCSTAYKYVPRKITDKQICAGGETGVDSCRGDSGGPLQFDGVIKTEPDIQFLAGIVSFGTTECGTKDVPGVYTNVTSYIDWILDNMKP